MPRSRLAHRLTGGRQFGFSMNCSRFLIGRRGAVLLTIGICWTLFGIGIVVDPGRGLPTSYVLLYEHVPLAIRSGIWVATGLFAIAAAFRRKAGADRWGFAGLVIMPLARAISYVYASLLAVFTNDGYARGIVTAAVWAAVVGLVVIVAGWKEPPT